MKHFVFQIEGGKDGVGMISIPDDTLMSRVPEGAIEVSASPVPEDRSGEFFEAWRLEEDGEIVVDVEKAKEIRLKYLRDRREKMLLHLDREQFRAHFAKESVAVERIEAEKKALRDFPERIDWDSVVTARECSHVLPPELI